MTNVLAKDQWISFYIDDALYAQSIHDVREIVPHREASPVPGSPNEVEGIVNIRGDVISVINGRQLMGLSNNHNNQEDSAILIIENQSNLLGFSIDKIGEIVGFNNDDIERNHAEHDLIKGTVHLDEELYIITDLTRYTNQPNDYE